MLEKNCKDSILLLNLSLFQNYRKSIGRITTVHKFIMEIIVASNRFNWYTPFHMFMIMFLKNIKKIKTG